MTYMAQIVVEGATVYHVVLGMNLEEVEIRQGFKNLPEMLRLQPESAALRQPVRGGQERRCDQALVWQACSSQALPVRCCDQPIFGLNSFIWPWPVGEVGEVVFSQVPFGTSDQALLW